MKNRGCVTLLACLKVGCNIQSRYFAQGALFHTRSNRQVKLHALYSPFSKRNVINPVFSFSNQLICFNSLFAKHSKTTSNLYKLYGSNTCNCLHFQYAQSNAVFQRFYSLSLNYFQSQQHYHFTQGKENSKISSVLYFSSILVFMVGLAYAAVPLYRMFCQATGLGGDPKLGHKIEKVGTMEPIRARKIHVSFNADHHASMQWNFKPSQQSITVVPGETALAFYTAKNPTDKPIVGIATYNVVPFQAGLYFNKIQCFCFEEQWLNPNEEVDMPVFFYIDPDYDDDPQLANTDDIILSYTFFKAEEGQTLPLPGFMKANSVVNLNAKSE